MTYFDHNATSPLHPAARLAWMESTDNLIGNPSSPHRLGSRADTALEEARSRLAGMIGCEAHHIVWTSGATESNNQLLHHFAASLPPDAMVWISAIEHPSVLESASHYVPGRVRLIQVSNCGVVDLQWLSENLAQQRPGLVAVMAANNVTGIIQPWAEIARICRQWQVLYFCDAVQWLGKESPEGLGQCDFVSGCAHKIGGPRGIGFLKVPAQSSLKPLLFGGAQEDSRRAGTENVAGAQALVAILEARHGLMNKRESRRLMIECFSDRVVQQVPGAEIVGGMNPRLWNTVAVMLPEVDCRQRWVVKLDKQGFAVSTGSACSSGKEEPSPVLLAMGYSPSQAARVLRFSSGWETQEQDWDALLNAIVRADRELRTSNVG